MTPAVALDPPARGQPRRTDGEHEQSPEGDEDDPGGDEEIAGCKIGSETLAHGIRCMS